MISDKQLVRSSACLELVRGPYEECQYITPAWADTPLSIGRRERMGSRFGRPVYSRVADS